MIAFVAHLLFALMWLLLADRPSGSTFLVGYLTGFALLWLLAPVLRAESYVRRTLAFLRFLWVFTREFLVSNWTLAKIILLTKKEDIRPAFIEYETAHLTPVEVLLLTHCITLTPGTTSVDLTPDRKVLTIHAFDGAHPEQVRQSIRSSLEAAILGFTRP